MKNSKKMIEIIEKKKELSEEKTPKYGTRKLSIGLVSCMLGFSLIIAPCSSKAIELKESPEAAASEKNIPETPVVDETKPAETPKEETATPVENPTETTPAVEKKVETKQADTFKANLQTITVDQGKNVEDYKKAITNLPQDAKLDVTTPADTKEAGEKAVKATITFSDGSTKEVEIKVNVNPVEKTEEKNTENSLEVSPEEEKTGVTAPNEGVDAISSATYYNKANWENKIKDESRWKVGDNQRLVRVTTSEPVEMNDIDYDGNFVDANGRTVLRMVYKEKGAAATAVWYRGIFNFGELDQYIDYEKSYIVGVNIAGNEANRGNLEPFNDRKERIVDLGVLRGDLTNQRKNLPINLVLKEGVTIETLGKKNYIVQMRLADKKGKRIYAYAPKGSSMDYSSYTKTTSVSLEDKVNRLFIKGGKQDDGNNATNQEFFMSEFIANPEQYKDEKNLGIIRTQYMGQRKGNDKSPTTGGQPIAFTQAFDAKLLDYLKADDDGNVAYVNVLDNTRKVSKWAHNFGIKKTDFNLSKDGKLAYLVIGTHDFQKEGVKKVEIPQHDQYSMLSGFYITAIDYVVDKSKFEDTFAGRTTGIGATRKLNYSMISGWTNPNQDGWTIFEKTYEDGYVAHEGESFIIDTTTDPSDKQIMIKIGDEDAIIRKQQGYYTYYVTSDKGIEKIEKYADGIFKFDLREGATIKPGDKIKIFMPYAKDHDAPVNFLEINNGTELNKGGATLTLQKDRNINMHLYKEGNKGYYILKYTLADGTPGEKKFEPKGLWNFDNKDRVMDPGSNKATLSSGGNFYINTKKLKPGADIFVESYDENGNKIDDQTSWFKYRALTKAQDTVKELTWTDHSDKSSILSINKSLYTPYQLIFTNDYAEGTDDFYKDPRAFAGTNEDFMKDTKEFVGYTKYDGGKIRTLYEGKDKRLYAKVVADENEYDKDGNLVGGDKSKMITIPKSDIFDAQFEGENKEYRAYEYTVNLREMLLYHSEDKTPQPLTLLKDMKFVTTASDGSSLPSDLYETRVRARVLFDANTGKFADGTDKDVKIAPDNINFYDQEDYKPNGFVGANVKEGTGDEFAKAPTLTGKNFLGWVTKEGKAALGDKAVVTADAFNALAKDQIFTNETPITKHLVVYAVYSDEVTVTFDADGGKFTDGKDTTNVKVEGGNVTKPADPTRDGFTFKGWADTKDATTPNVTEFTGITAPKTYYAVWEQTDKTPLKLNDPEKTVVKDKTSLTEPEQEKVEAAVIAANPDLKLTKEDVVVDDDGTVTVTKDGKTGTITPDKTVEQEKVQNKFNPPKEPVKVVDKTKLTPEEKQAVKDAINEANPDRNFKDDEITVKDDGSVSIDQGGKVGSFTPDQTVVQKDTILNLQAPDKTEVKDVTDLTQEEKDKVAAAVKAKNNLADDDKIEVDSKGNVTVTTADGKKTGTLEGKDTVKPFDRAGKTLNDPAITTVADTNNLTEQEKQAVKDAVKKANPDLDFKDDEIQVADNGEVTVPMGTAGNKTIAADKTVKKATAEDKMIALKAPEKTEVVDKSNLTQEEKDKVIAAVKIANPNLPKDATITVANDGSVIVTQGTGENKKVGQLSQDDTVYEKIKAPETPVIVKDPSNLTPKEKEAVEDSVKTANPNLPKDAKVTVGNDGSVTVTDKDGKEIGKLTPEQTVKKAGTVVAPTEPVEVKDPSNLTPEEKKDVEDAVKKANPDLPKDAKVTVGNDGSVTVTDKDGKEIGKLTPDKTVKKAEDEAAKVVAPAEPVKVKDPSKLTDDEKKAVEQAVKDANKDLPADAKVTVGDDGTVTVTDKDGKEIGKLTPDKTVKAKTPEVNKKPLQDEVDKGNATKDNDKYKNADQDKKDAYDKALADAEKVLKDPNASQDAVNKAKQALADAEKALNGESASVDKKALEAEAAKKDATKASDKYNNADKDKKDAYDKALADAEKVLKDPNASQDDVNKAKQALADAEKALNGESSQAVNKKPLEAEAAKKDSTKASDKYKNADKEKKDAYDKALADAEKVLADPNASQEEVDKAKKALADAEKALNGKASEEETDAQKNPAVIPSKTIVGDKNKLTDKEKAEVIEKVKKANPKAIKVAVADNGTATLTYPDRSTNTIEGSKLVDKKSGEGERKAGKVYVNKKANGNSNNVQTGVGSLAGTLATLTTAIGGLFASKKKKRK